MGHNQQNQQNQNPRHDKDHSKDQQGGCGCSSGMDGNQQAAQTPAANRPGAQHDQNNPAGRAAQGNQDHAQAQKSQRELDAERRERHDRNSGQLQNSDGDQTGAPDDETNMRDRAPGQKQGQSHNQNQPNT